MADLTIDLSKVDELVADFYEELDAFLAPHRSAQVPLLAAEFMERVSPERFLAWAWSRSHDLVRREMHHRFPAVDQSLAEKMAQPEAATEGELRAVANRYEEKASRHSTREAAADKRLAQGLMADRWVVPSTGISTRLDEMTKDNLLEVAGALETQARILQARAEFMRALAADLPKGKTVADHFAPAKVQKMWDTYVGLHAA